MNSLKQTVLQTTLQFCVEIKILRVRPVHVYNYTHIHVDVNRSTHTKERTCSTNLLSRLLGMGDDLFCCLFRSGDLFFGSGDFLLISGDLLPCIL